MQRPIFPGSKTTWGAITVFLSVWILTYAFLRLTGRAALSYGSIIGSGLSGAVGMLVTAFVGSRLRSRP